ncbi:MAG: NnrU family protein [Pseudomonadota bacterium]
MDLLKFGVLLWILAHWFKRIAPGLRARMGDSGKAVVAVLLLVSLVMMVIGYRRADFVVAYTPPAWGVHLNNLLMLLAVYLFAASGAKTWVARKIRHPMLNAAIVWAIAHLLVNGDYASLILFGGILVWAVASIWLINLREPEWTPPAPVPVAKEIRTAIIAVVAYAGIAAIHWGLGYPPFA